MKNDGLGEFDKIWTDVRGFMPVNSRILITGANGLVASNLVDAFMHFNKKYDTHNHIEAVCRNREKAEKRFVDYVGSDEFSICCQDVCDFELDQPCDYIFHTASNAHPLAYSIKPIETIKTNVIGTMKILEYAVKANVKKIVYVSTSEIYGDKNADTANERFVETEYGSINTLVPRSCYSESKRCAETVCICYGQEKDLDIKIVRPGYIYGAQITDENSRAESRLTRRLISPKKVLPGMNPAQSFQLPVIRRLQADAQTVDPRLPVGKELFFCDGSRIQLRCNLRVPVYPKRIVNRAENLLRLSGL